jgi:hypothetical protein
MKWICTALTARNTRTVRATVPSTTFDLMLIAKMRKLGIPWSSDGVSQKNPGMRAQPDSSCHSM